MGHFFCADHFQSKEIQLTCDYSVCRCRCKGRVELTNVSLRAAPGTAFLTKKKKKKKKKFWSILKCLLSNGAVENFIYLKLPCKKLFGFFLFLPNISLKAFSMLNSLQRENFSLKNPTLSLCGAAFHFSSNAISLWSLKGF